MKSVLNFLASWWEVSKLSIVLTSLTLISLLILKFGYGIETRLFGYFYGAAFFGGVLIVSNIHMALYRLRRKKRNATMEKPIS